MPKVALKSLKHGNSTPNGFLKLTISPIVFIKYGDGRDIKSNNGVFRHFHLSSVIISSIKFKGYGDKMSNGFDLKYSLIVSISKYPLFVKLIGISIILTPIFLMD